jgi:hypothetical protein
MFEVDIKELKLLGGFNHPNIVRFVRVHYFYVHGRAFNIPFGSWASVSRKIHVSPL